MLDISDIHLGSAMKFDGQPYVVIWMQHSKQGRAGAILRFKIKNLLDGRVLEKSFHGSDKAEEADLERSKASYLYQDQSFAYFMNIGNYEQFNIDLSQVEGQLVYLREGDNVDVLYFEGRPVTISLPNKVNLKVTETIDGVRGDTAQGKVTKPATLETGMEIFVPLFIKEGDIVKVSTETGDYVERVNE